MAESTIDDNFNKPTYPLSLRRYKSVMEVWAWEAVYFHPL